MKLALDLPCILLLAAARQRAASPLSIQQEPLPALDLLEPDLSELALRGHD